MDVRSSQLERSGNPLDPGSLPGALLQFNHCPLQQNPIFGYLKFLRHVRHETFHDRFDLAAYHAVMRTGEAGVAEERSTAWKNLFVGGLHMSMSANDGTDLPIEHARQSDLLGR